MAGAGAVFQLPGTGGEPVPARLSAGWFNDSPSIQIRGVRHPLGPAVPMWLRIVGSVPVALVVVGLAGAAVGILAVLLNSILLRSAMDPRRARIVVPLVSVVSLLVTLVVVGVVLGSGFAFPVFG